jgi:hypothetical protein
MQINCPNKVRGAVRNGGVPHRGGGSGDDSNRRSNRLYGKLNYLEERNNSNKAVIGTLQILSYPRQVLFDIDALPHSSLRNSLINIGLVGLS